MTTSAGNAVVSVPTFQPGDVQHRRRIATWATVVQQRLDGHDSSISAVNTAVTNLQNSLSAQEVVVALVVGNENAQAFVAASFTAVTTWLTPDVDTHSAFNATTGVYTVPQNGLYQVNGALLTNAVSFTAPGVVLPFILVNGANVRRGWKGIDATNTDNQGAQVYGLFSCSVGTTIALGLYVSTPCTLYAGANDGRFYNRLHIHKVK